MSWRISTTVNRAKTLRLALVLGAALVCVAVVPAASAQCNDATPTRPILFVHGFYGSSTDWGGGNDYGIGGIKGSVIASLSSISGYSNYSTYVLYFNGTNVLLSLGDPATDPVVSNISGNAGYVPCDARFFSIRFYGWEGPGSAFDPQVVANVSIITKAYELSEVIKAITGLTFSKDVIVAAHSMGALDTRAYIEQLGSPYDEPCNAYPCYEAGTLNYTGDVAQLVSVDGPNAGSDWANILATLLGKVYTQWINVFELEPNNDSCPSAPEPCSLIPPLNYHSSYNGVQASPLPVGFTIDAIKDYYSDQNPLEACTLDPNQLCAWDNIVTTDSQSIVQPLAAQSQTGLNDVDNSYSVSDSTITSNADCHFLGTVGLPQTLMLHSLLCLGDWHPSAEAQVGSLVSNSIVPSVDGQLTQVVIQVLYNGQQYSGANLLLNGPNGSTPLTSTAQATVLTGPEAPASPAIPTVPQVAPTPYSLTYQSGGPGGTGAPTIVGVDQNGTVCSPCYVTSASGNGAQPNWGITFVVTFPSNNANSPTVTTLAPTSVDGDGATLQGTVNPNGAATTAWFEWGTTPSYGNTTLSQPIGSGSTAVPVSFALSGLTSNTTYFYRIDANNSKGTSYGALDSFATLGTLPAPTLTSPSNGSGNIPTTSTFSWTSVAGATSYRIMVATTPGALPSDPTSSTCGAGCVIDDTASATSYTPLNGILVAGTTYYWEVHARSPQQYGNWSTVFSFSTAEPALIGMTISPSTVTSGSSSTVTVTLDGPAPQNGAQVNLTTTNNSAFPVPSSLTISGGSTTGSISVQAGTVSAPTGVTVTATYDSSTTSGGVTVSPSGGSVFLSSFTITPSTIVGGYSPQGSVFLTGPAPAGGAVVNLSSNNTHFVQVPTSQTVTVQPGYTSAGFPITTSFTSGTVGATITASYNNTMYGAGLTVLPVAATGVTFYPSNVDAGSPAQFTVYLNGPAPAGTSVSLTSSSPSVLQVPGSVAVPTGSTSVSVTGTTFSISSQTNVTVTATYNGGSAQGSASVVPLSLIGFSLSGSEVTGGSSVTGTVWLSDIAPSGGVNVSLSSASNLVQVPPTATIPSGSSSTTFTATTSGVGSVNNVTLTASYNGVSYNLILTLVPPLPYLASLSFAPATVNSGSATVGTVTLTAPAPLGGAGVSLTSSFYAVADVPNGVAVQAGATSANFTVTTAPIGFISPVTVQATYNGTTQSALIIVVPPGTPLAPSSLTLSPPVVTGGYSSTATILLTGAAPTGGALITLSSDNAGVQVPPILTVPAGLNSAVFTATTSSVSAVATATIKTTYNGLSQSSLLTVEPAGTPPVGNPVPFLSAPLAPASHIPGGAGLSVSVNGSGFVPGVQASWNGTTIPTTYISALQLQASIPAGSVQTNGSGVVTVTNPGPVNPPSNALAEYVTYPTSAPSFNPVPLTSMEQPANVVVGDLNGDGKPDLIVGHYFTGLSVFLGNGDGTFGPELLLQGSSPASAIGDFNGDGKPDIVTIIGSSIRLYLGNGDGTFTSTPDTPFAGVYAGNTSLAVGDFNGDGKLDVVVTGNDLTQAYVLLGNGDGTFGGPTSVGSVNQPFSVAVADFNGDGKLDIALADTSNASVAILLGNGDGTFQPQIEYPANGYPYALAVADFNGDQHPDIAISNYGPTGGSGGGVSVLLNNGNGTFAAPVNYAAGGEFYFLTASDVNGDNKLDLVVASTSPNQATLLFLGNGDGTFSSTPITLSSGTSTLFNAAADLNGDGAPDVVVSNFENGSGNISILLQSITSVLQVTPSSLAFTFTQGGGSPSPLSLAIANTGGGTEAWSATTSQPWLVLGQSTGTAPSTLSVSVNPAGLNPGTYTAAITVTAVGASNSPQVVSVTLTVNPVPVVINSLTLNPSVLVGPGTSTGTVALSGLAPVGGASVGLSSNNSAVQVPSVVTVPAGQNSTTFTATASAVTNQTVATVTATYNGGSTTAALTVNPNTLPLTVSPATLSFAKQALGSTSAAKKVTLTNKTGVVVTGISWAVIATNPNDFQQSAATCGQTLNVKASCTISLVFAPGAIGARSATLRITDSASNSPHSVSLTGTGILPVAISPSTLKFAATKVGATSSAKVVTITNDLPGTLTISGITIEGTNPADFAVKSTTCGATLTAGSSCSVNVTFTPTAKGIRAASLNISDSAITSPQTVALSGTGK
jgi:pimeloyl-ACP methyl ester carboxylesterase